MSQNAKISVIMPSYNVIDYIIECMDSVVNQSFKDLEIICIDANSTDGTLDVLKVYEKNYPNITLLISDKKSYGYQMNTALKHATGDYIAVVETDDYIDTKMYEILYDNSMDGTIDIVKSNFYHLNDANKNHPYTNIDKAKDKLADVKESFNLKDNINFLNGHPSIWAGIYRRAFLEENNITFFEEPGGGWVDNPFFYETAIVAKTIMYVNIPLYYYRESNMESSSHTFTDYSIPMRRVLDIFEILKKHDYYDKDVMIKFYYRLFRYIEIIFENQNNSTHNLDVKTVRSIDEVLNKVDEDIVKELTPKFQKIYYKYHSPLFLRRYDAE